MADPSLKRSTILENLKALQNEAARAMDALADGRIPFDEAESTISGFLADVMSASQLGIFSWGDLDSFQEEAAALTAMLKTFETDRRTSAAATTNTLKRPLTMPVFHRTEPFYTLEDHGRPVYVKVLWVDSGSAKESLRVIRNRSIHSLKKFDRLLDGVYGFIDDNKCEISPSYVKESLDEADVIVAVKDAGNVQKIAALLLGEVDADRGTLYISVVCADPVTKVGNVGRVALSMALKYADDNDLDVELDALPRVIPYYARDGFKLRKSCMPGEAVMPIEPAEVAADLRKLPFSASAKRFLAKTVPAGLDKKCESDLYRDFDITDAKAARAAILKYETNRCGKDGVLMSRCRIDKRNDA